MPQFYTNFAQSTWNKHLFQLNTWNRLTQHIRHKNNCPIFGNISPLFLNDCQYSLHRLTTQSDHVTTTWLACGRLFGFHHNSQLLSLRQTVYFHYATESEQFRNNPSLPLQLPIPLPPSACLSVCLCVMTPQCWLCCRTAQIKSYSVDDISRICHCLGLMAHHWVVCGRHGNKQWRI